MRSSPPSDPRVLDIADEKGELCGRILADLGADVIRLEPPEGALSRRLPPFAPDARTTLYRAVRMLASAAWSSTGPGVMGTLQRGGVPAGLLAHARHHLEDPQLRTRVCLASRS